MVARSRRRDGRAFAAEPSPDVLGRVATLATKRAAVCAPSQRRAWHAALWRVPLVGGRAVAVGDAADARADRREHGALRHSLLGHGHRRIHSDGGVHRRVARAMVSVRHVLSVVPRAWTALAPSPAVGLERRRWWTEGNERLYAGGRGIEQPARRTHSQEVSRAALSSPAVHLHGRARNSRHGPADDARDVAALSRRCQGGGERRSVL